MGDTCAPTRIELELSEIAGRIRDVLCTQGLDKKGARQSSIPVPRKEAIKSQYLNGGSVSLTLWERSIMGSYFPLSSCFAKIPIHGPGLSLSPTTLHYMLYLYLLHDAGE